jgi:polyhydroxyalkanoate synthesis regulator phasin
MAKISEIFSGGDSKSRVFVVLGTIIGIFAVVFIGSKMLGTSKTSGQAKIAGAPTLQSIPGGNLTPEYDRALRQSNANLAKQAEISGGSAVPTLVNAPTDDQPTTTSSNCTVTCPDSEAADVSTDINNLLKDGKLSAADANELLLLAKNNVPVSEYAAHLADLVKQGKLTPEQARKLLAEYTKQHANASAVPSALMMDAFIKSGKLSLEAANSLLALQKQNASPVEYQAALDKLVREGKLTPAAAAQLMAQYNQQLRQDVAQEGGAQLRQMAESGEITAAVAADLAALQKKNVSVGDYAAELNRLVAEGKMTPAAAAKLLAQYRLQHTGIEGGSASLASVDPASALADLVRSGQVSPEVASDLLALQKSNASVGDYKAELDKLVASGKLTPEMAAKLLAQYTAAHAGAGPAGALNALVSTAEAKNMAGIGDPEGTGQLSHEAAAQLRDMQKQNVSAEDYANAVDALVKAGKLTPEAAQKLKDNYNKLQGLRSQAKTLIDLQANGAPVPAYKTELSQAVVKKVLEPETASNLLQQYQALSAPLPALPVAPGSGVTPSFASNTPGAQDFSVLQQRIAADQANRPAPAVAAGASDEGQFEADAAAADAEALKAHQQRIQDLMAQMTSQAQSLVAAWTPPQMSFKGGTDFSKKSSGAEGLTQAQNNNKSSKSAGVEVAPLIKAGTILFAVLTTAVDSDYPDTPVMATIVSGEFKGATLLGKLALATGQDKVSLNFTLMNRDDWIKTKSVTAFAIDPDTARTVMASSVDNHYMLRYGTLFASSFVTGYANGISQSGSTSTSGIFGTSSTHPQLSPGEKIAVGLGQVGTTFGTALQSYVNTPATVKVNSGVGLGILFMADVAATSDAPTSTSTTTSTTTSTSH